MKNGKKKRTADRCWTHDRQRRESGMIVELKKKPGTRDRLSLSIKKKKKKA